MAFFLFVALMWATATAQSAQPFICTPPKAVPGGPPLPDLPDQFTARIEANIINRGYTVEILEYYDVPNDRGRIESSSRRFRGTTTIYTFADKQYFRINNTDNTCTVRSISPSNPFNPFATFDAQGNPHIRGVADFFRLGKRYGEVYVGRDVVRGIQAHRWRACANTTFGGNYTIDWYFASEANWTTNVRGQPLRAVIEGVDPQFNPITRMVNMSMLHYFKHNYEFTVFKVGQPDSTLFQIPRGIFCDGGKVARNLPSVPDSFSVRFQTVPVKGEISHFQEYYDTKSQKFYARGVNSRYGLYSVLQDLELGLLYTFINGSTCTTTNISSLTLTQYPGERALATQSSDNPSQLQLRPVASLWGFSAGTNVTYVGTRTVNDVLCDVWQEERNDLGGNSSIYEVSFSKPSLGYRVVGKTSLERRVPVKLELYSKSLIGKTPDQMQPWESRTYINVFEFDVSPSMPDIELLSCYGKWATFWFSVRGAYSQIKDMDDFIRAATNSISVSARVHLSRVGHLHVLPSSKDNSIVIEGTLLDKPSVPTYKSTGSTLDMAVKNLQQTINSGSGFVFTSGGYSYSTVTQSFTQVPASNSGSGYGAGVVAGVAIAMAIVGGLIGAIILYFVMKNRGTLQMGYKTQAD